MTRQFKIQVITKSGFPVTISGEYPEEYDLTLAMLEDSDYGYTPQIVQAPRALPSQSNGGEEIPDNLRCQFNPQHRVTGNPLIGSNGPFTAEQIAKRRSEKMGKMGKTALPVCTDCWNKGGH